MRLRELFSAFVLCGALGVRAAAGPAEVVLDKDMPDGSHVFVMKMVDGSFMTRTTAKKGPDGRPGATTESMSKEAPPELLRAALIRRMTHRRKSPSTGPADLNVARPGEPAPSSDQTAPGPEGGPYDAAAPHEAAAPNGDAPPGAADGAEDPARQEADDAAAAKAAAIGEKAAGDASKAEGQMGKMAGPEAGGALGGGGGAAGGGAGGAAGGGGSAAGPALKPELLAAVSGPYASTLGDMGLKLGRRADGTETIVNGEGRPASPGALAELERRLAEAPKAALKRPDFDRIVPKEDFQALKSGWSSQPSGGNAAFQDIGMTPGNRDFAWTKSCDKVSGKCNPLATESSYKKNDDVAPETLAAVGKAIQLNPEAGRADLEAMVRAAQADAQARVMQSGEEPSGGSSWLGFLRPEAQRPRGLQRPERPVRWPYYLLAAMSAVWLLWLWFSSRRRSPVGAAKLPE